MKTGLHLNGTFCTGEDPKEGKVQGWPIQFLHDLMTSSLISVIQFFSCMISFILSLDHLGLSYSYLARERKFPKVPEISLHESLIWNVLDAHLWTDNGTKGEVFVDQLSPEPPVQVRDPGCGFSIWRHRWDDQERCDTSNKIMVWSKRGS